MKLMITEDNGLIRETYSTYFKMTGFEVYSFETAEEALNSDVKPDIILTDYDMGHGMHGLDYAQIQRERFPKSTIVVNTGNIGLENELLQYHNKRIINEYAFKPVRPSQLKGLFGIN